VTLLARCPNCGVEVDEAAEDRCPSCSVPLKVVCSNCGEKVPADAEECPACDASLTHAVDTL
jgi:RNA polymerase subunit RPABC4/transcription elongation factor Spt4